MQPTSTNVIKAANASGSSMNAMLKPQMLATVLNVYFSDPALGGNKIGAPRLIGVVIDLQVICQMNNLPGGISSCTGTYWNVSSAFGGATTMTVSQMLTYAASKSNVGGSTWYANVNRRSSWRRTPSMLLTTGWPSPDKQTRGRYPSPAPSAHSGGSPHVAAAHFAAGNLNMKPRGACAPVLLGGAPPHR